MTIGINHNHLKGAKVLFINMPLRESSRPTAVPEGPLLMATNLRENYGVEPTVVDLNAYRIKDQSAVSHGLPDGRHLTFDEAQGLIERHVNYHGEPHLIGLSGMITTLRWQEEMARRLRKILPNSFLVSGGGLATQLKAGAFRFIPELDAVVDSEGDQIITTIVADAMKTKRNQPPHRFLYEGGRPGALDQYPHADLSFLAKDIDGNPVLSWYLNTPAWSVNVGTSSAIPWDDASVIPKTNSVSSRGCPFGCTYCFRGAQGERNWGTRSAAHLYREMVENMERYRIKFHAFPDDNFAVAVGRITEMVPLFKDLGLRWGTHTRLDEAAGLRSDEQGGFVLEDPRRVELMAKAGCIYIGFGPESASSRILEVVGKGGHTLTNGTEKVLVADEQEEFPRSMVRGIQHAAQFGIHGNCTWILGSPTETLADIKQTVRFMLWQEEECERNGLPRSSVNKRMFTMTWYPGVELINHERVRAELTRVFNLQFEKTPEFGRPAKPWYQPILDENYHQYLLLLDDATKVLEAPDGRPLHFDDMPDEVFLQAREYVDSGQTLEILNM